MANTRDLLIRLLGDSSGMKKALGEADAATDKHDLSLKRLAGTVGSAYATTKVIEFGKTSVDAASDVAEAQSKVNVIFGASAGTIQSWSDTTSSALGLSKLGALDAASTFATFGKSAGLAGEDLSSFGIDLTTLASDLASFHNTSPEQAIEAIGAALRGESEPIRQYGVLLDDATLKARATTLGIYEGSGALTAQQKVLAAQAEIMAQTTDAQGDFARTSDGLAGSQKILTARFADMQAKIGTALMPIMQELVGVLSGVAEWFTNLDEGTQTWIIRIGMLGGGLVLAGRAVTGITGGLRALGLVSATTTASMSPLMLALAGVAAAAGAGIAIYSALSSEKKELRAITDDFVAALKAEAEGQQGATMAAIEAKIAHGDAFEIGQKLGFSARDIAKIIKGQSVPAWDALNATLDSSSMRMLSGDLKLQELKKTYGIAGLEVIDFRAEITQLSGAMSIAQDEVAHAGQVSAAFGVTTDTTTAAVKAGTAESKNFADMLNGGVVGALWAATQAQAAHRAEMNEARIAAHGLKDKQFELHAEMWRVEAAARAQDAAWAELFGKYDDTTSFLNIQTSFDGLVAKVAETKTAIKEHTVSQEQGMRDVGVAIIATKREVAEYIEKLGIIPASKATEINAMIDKGQYDAVEKELAWLTRKRDMAVGVTFTDKGGSSLIGARAGGGPVSAGGAYLVGEKGPELLQMGNQPGVIIPNNKLTGVGTGGGATVNEFHFHGPVMGEQDFIRRLEEGRQDMIRRGAVLVPT